MSVSSFYLLLKVIEQGKPCQLHFIFTNLVIVTEGSMLKIVNNAAVAETIIPIAFND